MIKYYIIPKINRELKQEIIPDYDTWNYIIPKINRELKQQISHLVHI